MSTRSYDEISSALIRAIPRGEELRGLSSEELKSLRSLSNVLDNQAYLELQRREKAVQA